MFEKQTNVDLAELTERVRCKLKQENISKVAVEVGYEYPKLAHFARRPPGTFVKPDMINRLCKYFDIQLVEIERDAA